MTATSKPAEISVYDWAGWSMALFALLVILPLHLLAALLAGMLVYELTHALIGVIHRRLFSRRATAQLLAITLIAIIIGSLIALSVTGIVAFLRSGDESIPRLLQKMAEIIDGSKAVLPEWLQEYLPGDADDLRTTLVAWLRENAGLVQNAGQQAGLAAAHLLFGMLIGALLSMSVPELKSDRRPLARSLVERVGRLRESFRSVVLAQGIIATLYLSITWIYLGLALPLLGVQLPLTKTMLAVTFVAGLLPVVGNLVSNAVIVIVSLSYSPYIAGVSLVYLVAIHKLGYFLNAKIIGGRIHASAWELLLAMLVMEAAFGISGLVAAPLYYAYLKNELTAKRLV